MKRMQTVEEKTNEYGEPLDHCGDITCNSDYWDCECTTEYIHHYSVARCWRCGAEYEDSPSARENEVEEWRNR
jgi:hypothetical protein